MEKRLDIRDRHASVHPPTEAVCKHTTNALNKGSKWSFKASASHVSGLIKLIIADAACPRTRSQIAPAGDPVVIIVNDNRK